MYLLLPLHLNQNTPHRIHKDTLDGMFEHRNMSNGTLGLHRLAAITTRNTFTHFTNWKQHTKAPWGIPGTLWAAKLKGLFSIDWEQRSYML